MLALDPDLECLGNRLDAARHCLSIATSPWAKRHWDETYRYLLRKWIQMVAGQRTIWEPYYVHRNWLTVDDVSEVMSIVDKQVELLLNNFRKQEFAVDLLEIPRTRSALQTK